MIFYFFFFFFICILWQSDLKLDLERIWTAFIQYYWMILSPDIKEKKWLSWLKVVETYIHREGNNIKGVIIQHLVNMFNCWHVNIKAFDIKIEKPAYFEKHSGTRKWDKILRDVLSTTSAEETTTCLPPRAQYIRASVDL